MTLASTFASFMARRRLAQEYHRMKRDTSSKDMIEKAQPTNEADFLHWEAFVLGPKETPYQQGRFRLELTFNREYPFKPPKLQCATRIYHPNIGRNGSVCMDILDKAWSPALTVTTVLLSFVSLLGNPNPEDPLNPEAAKLYREHKARYLDQAQQWTRIYARGN